MIISDISKLDTKQLDVAGTIEECIEEHFRNTVQINARILSISTMRQILEDSYSDDDKDEMCQRGQRKRAEMMKVLIVSHCLQTKNKYPFSSIDKDEKIGVNK